MGVDVEIALHIANAQIDSTHVRTKLHRTSENYLHIPVWARLKINNLT